MFELWDHDKMSKDDKLGTFTINASKVHTVYYSQYPNLLYYLKEVENF